MRNNSKIQFSKKARPVICPDSETIQKKPDMGAACNVLTSVVRLVSHKSFLKKPRQTTQPL